MFHALQDAAVEALNIEPAWIADRNAIYLERLRIIVEGLLTLGIEASLPKAALYVWASIPAGETSERLARRWLEQAGVAVAPGPFFGPAGEGYIRVSATAPTDRIREAMDRLQRL
jgi:LL-diaminopimelate aminotransferase